MENPTREPGQEGLLLISIGSRSIRSFVDDSLVALRLKDAELLLDFAQPAFVQPITQQWEQLAREIRNRIRPCLDDPAIERFHLFYRGPVAIPPLLGALFAGHRPLVVYQWHDSHYVRVYTLDRRFLIATD